MILVPGSTSSGSRRFVAFLALPLLLRLLALAPASQRLGAVAHATTLHAGQLSHPGFGWKRRLQALPLSFELNEGQVDRHVRFLAREDGFTLFLTSSGAMFVPTTSPGLRDQDRVSRGGVRLRFVHASSRLRLVGLDPLPGRVNYLIGRSPQRWHTDIPTYARVAYRDVYPGIDLVYHGAGGQLEYDWVLQPGARADEIRLAVDGARVGELGLGADGSLILTTSAGRMVQRKPRVYQMIGRRRQIIAAHWLLDRHQQIGFRLGTYDRRRPLIVDPVLTYSTYLGGSSSDFAADVAVDGAGNAYVTGATQSTDFPTYNALQGSNHGGADGTDAFVTKLSASGSAVYYSTYLGGQGDDFARGIAVDARGDAYVTGGTPSTDFPTAGSVQPPLADGCNRGPRATGDVFITELNPRGNGLVYSHCVGGSSVDDGIRVAVDGAGDAYVVGTTASPDFPTVNAVQATLGGGEDAFVAKLDPSGSKLEYSTFLGGSDDETGTGIAIDAAGDAYVCGSTASPDFPTVHALRAAYPGGTEGGFVAKLDPTGAKLLYSTYLGGTGDDVASGIAVDAVGSAYVTGAATSSNFPTVNPFQAANRGQGDAFVSRLSPGGDRLVYSTYLGGSGNDGGLDIAADAGGDAYVTGFSHSKNFPTVAAVQPLYGGGYYYGDAFVTKLNPDGHTLAYSTYLGGNSDDVGMGIAVDAAGDVFVAGGTSSLDFPEVGPRGLSRPPRGDAFVAKIGSASSASTGQPAITIDQVAILHEVKNDVQLTTVVRLNETAVFVALYHAMNAGRSRPSGAVRFLRQGKVVAGAAMQRKTLPDGTPYFVVSKRFLRQRLLGHLTAVITLRLSTARDTLSVGFNLKAHR